MTFCILHMIHVIYVCFYVRLLGFSIDKQLQGNREIRDLRLHRYIPVEQPRVMIKEK